MDFEFRTVPLIINRFGASGALGELLTAQFAPRRVLVVSDPGVVAAGLLRQPLASLEAAGIEAAVFDQVVADPPEAVVLAAAQRAGALGAQVIVGLGGGSSLDVAKLAAVLAQGDQPLAEMYGVGKVVGERLPLVQIPTTAGTGSEVTPISIVTTGETTKMGVVSPRLYADIALLDAELTLKLPPATTAATGIDAMVHAIEAYTSKHKKNPVSDALAREALRLLAGNLLAAWRDGNPEAREAMLLGSLLAGQAFANAPVAAVHALAYPIGGIFHVPHGLSNTLVLPHVLRFNAPEAHTQYAELAEILAPRATGSSEAKTEAFIAALEELADGVQVQRRLQAVGIGHNHLPQLAEQAMLQTRLLVNNPREVTYQDALAIYRAAL